jgi:hypothetical protein
MLGKAAEWKQRFGIRKRPAPTIEADYAPKVGDRLALDRLAVEGRLAETLETLSAASPLLLTGHLHQGYGDQ